MSRQNVNFPLFPEIGDGNFATPNAAFGLVVRDPYRTHREVIGADPLRDIKIK